MVICAPGGCEGLCVLQVDYSVRVHIAGSCSSFNNTINLLPSELLMLSPKQ